MVLEATNQFLINDLLFGPTLFNFRIYAEGLAQNPYSFLVARSTRIVFLCVNQLCLVTRQVNENTQNQVRKLSLRYRHEIGASVPSGRTSKCLDSPNQNKLTCIMTALCLLTIINCPKIKWTINKVSGTTSYRICFILSGIIIMIVKILLCFSLNSITINYLYSLIN